MLRSDPSLVFTLKYWAPIILFGGTSVFWSGRFRWAQLIILIPQVVGALFLASLAIFEVPDGGIRYRRTLKWKRLDFEEIVSCGVFWGAGIGYISLNRFVSPWGRIYFVLDRNLNPNPFRPGEYALLRYLRKEPVQKEESVKSSLVEDRRLKFKLVTAGAAGVLVPLLWLFLIPRPIPRSVLERPWDFGKAAWVEVPLRAFHLLNSFPGALVVFVIFVLLATYRWRRPNAWTFAFVAGAALASILNNLLAK